MKKKQLLALIVIGVVLAAAAVWVSRRQSAPYLQTTEVGSKLLPDLDINAVATIQIRSASNVVTLAKDETAWVVKERGGYPANFNTLSELMQKLWDLKIARTVPGGTSRLPALGLDGADKSSTLLELKAADGKVILSLLVGASSQHERGWPSGRYVMVGNDPKTVCFVAESLSEVEATADRWLNKDFFRIEKLKSVRVTTGVATNDWMLTRDNESADWRLADAKPGEKLDSSKTAGISSLFSYPSFEDVIPGIIELKNPVVATIETFDGFSYTIRTARATNDNYHLQVNVTASLPKDRAPGKDEKPEDKERLDREFTERREKLQAKLKTEQAFGKWTFVVSKWTVDQLLKTRADFLEEKKGDGSPPTSQTTTNTPPAKN
ncbi:MAG: DUF4340 domain-containing protein [Verrucomicrobiae bacterium]|nr:DUF4340 domain-containing protein [Verrucomicrobiae bacterium]